MMLVIYRYIGPIGWKLNIISYMYVESATMFNVLAIDCFMADSIAAACN